MATEQANKPKIAPEQLEALSKATGIDPARGGAFAFVQGFLESANRFQSDDGKEYHTLKIGVTGGQVKVSCDPASPEWAALQEVKPGTPIAVLASAVVDSNGKLKGNATGFGSSVHIVKVG